MNTQHLVDPQPLAHVTTLSPVDLSAGKLPAFRVLFSENQPGVGIPEGRSLEARQIPGPIGEPPVSLCIFRSHSARVGRSAILHLHGGGYSPGSAHNADEQNLAWVAELDCVVVSVDHRLALETPAQGPVEDAYAALTWVHGEAERLQIDRRLIAVAGEGVGGSLAAALVLLARDHGEIPVCYQMLLTYPTLGDRTTARRRAHCGEFVRTSEIYAISWRAYRGHEPNKDNVSPYAAPARVTSLGNLPPTFIALGSLDLFFEENLEYACRLSEFGVQVQLHVYPGAYHGFNNLKQSDLFRRCTADRLMGLRHAFAGAALRQGA